MYFELLDLYACVCVCACGMWAAKMFKYNGYTNVTKNAVTAQSFLQADLEC